MSSRRTESWDQLKIVGMVVGSDAPTENLRLEETAHAPLRGASPSHIESASELEELSTAIDCTSLALVDDAPSQSTSLLAEKQDCGVEGIFPHEGTGSAAPVAQNEECLSSAIANQTQGQVEQSNSASLSGENQDCGFEQKGCHGGAFSAAPVAQNEKSFNSVIANQTQGQVEQSNSASLLAENQDCGVEATISHEGACSAAPVSLNQSEIFEWLDRANVGECPPLWIIQYLLDSKYYASIRATISKFEKQWNISVVNYQVQKSSDTISRKI